MGKTINSFKGGFSTQKIIGTTLALVDVAGKRLAPGLAPENVKSSYMAGGWKALPSAVSKLWIAIGFLATAGSGFAAPLTAFVVVSIWAVWYAAQRGSKLSVGAGFNAFKASIWDARRPTLFILLAVVVLGQFIGFFAQLPLMTGIGVGTNNSLAGITAFVGGVVYFVGWYCLVKTSIDEALNGTDINAEQIFFAQLVTVLDVPPPTLTNDLVHNDPLGGFSIYPVPQRAIKPGMQENIRKRALEHLPEFELISASASHIIFARATETTLATRALSEASGGAVISRAPQASNTSYSKEDIE